MKSIPKRFKKVNTKQGTSSRGNVSVNADKSSFKNAAVLAATANSSINVVFSAKSVVKATDAVRDSLRISNGEKTSTPVRLSSNLVQKITTPSTPQNIDVSKSPPKLVEGVKFTAPKPPEPKPPPPPATGIYILDEPTKIAKVETKEEVLTPLQAPGINLSALRVPEEQSVFGLGSYFDLPINPEMSEKTTGIELKKWEKPRVIAIVAENVKDGYPTNNAIIFKKLTSNRVATSKYSIYRKAVFKDGVFSKIAELSNEQMLVPSRFTETINSLGYEVADTFVLIDSNISINATYVYKIEVEWTSTGKEPEQEVRFNISDVPRFFIGNT